MATAHIGTVLQQLRRTVLGRGSGGGTDGQLLTAFLERGDEEAFAALVRRHGPMVLGVCRRVTRDRHDAEDAFQATFLVLARKAGAVTPRERVAAWLHGVALRTARKARATAAKRRGRERPVAELPEPAASAPDPCPDLRPLLDRELNNLPEHYRLPILLCDLEGLAIKEAAGQLGWPQGTLAGRLARARKLLAQRLANRGVVPSAGGLAALLTRDAASAALPGNVLHSVTALAAGRATAPASVVSLTEGVVQSMMLSKLSQAALAGLALLCLFGLGVTGYQSSAAREPKEANRGGAAVRPAPPTLQGEWEVEAVQFGRDKTSLPIPKGKRLTIRGEQFIAPFPGGQRSARTFKVNPAAGPAAIDLFDDGTLVSRGLYALDGDRLTLCLGLTLAVSDGPGAAPKVSADERPTKIDPAEGVVFRLRRPGRTSGRRPDKTFEVVGAVKTPGVTGLTLPTPTKTQAAGPPGASTGPNPPPSGLAVTLPFTHPGPEVTSPAELVAPESRARPLVQEDVLFQVVSFLESLLGFWPGWLENVYSEDPADLERVIVPAGRIEPLPHRPETPRPLRLPASRP